MNPFVEKDVMPIRIRPRDKWANSHNSLKQQRRWRIVDEPSWRVIRTGTGRSGSYADRPKHCSGDASRHPNGPAARARDSGREARPESAATPDAAARPPVVPRLPVSRGAVRLKKGGERSSEKNLVVSPNYLHQTTNQEIYLCWTHKFV